MTKLFRARSLLYRADCPIPTIAPWLSQRTVTTAMPYGTHALNGVDLPGSRIHVSEQV